MKTPGSAGRLRIHPIDAMLGRWRLGGVLLTEAIHAAAGIHYFLLARVKRVACRADFYTEISTQGRTRFELVAAATNNINRGIGRVYFRLHGVFTAWRVRGARSIGSQRAAPQGESIQAAAIALRHDSRGSR